MDIQGSTYNLLSSSLPFQHLPSSKKKGKWIKENLDTLERIGLNQKAETKRFENIYKMLDGDIDYNSLEGGVTKEIREIREEFGLSNEIIHFDFVGQIKNQIVGEALRTKPDMIVDTIDPTSKSEYIEERGLKFKGMLLQQFDNFLNTALMQSGFEFQNDFQSDEEKQQYMQTLQQEKDKIKSPKEIEEEVSKSFKTVGALWGEAVLERDNKDYSMERMYSKEVEDKFLTGRWFRHYHMGYDYYKPENWSPLETFIDKDPHIEFPQEGEYIGRVTRMTPSAILNRYGTRLSYNEQMRLASKFNSHEGITGINVPGTSSNGGSVLSDAIFGKNYVVPYAGYFEDQERIQIEQAFNVPMGERIYADENNNEVKMPVFLGSRGLEIDDYTRRDFTPRQDMLRVTEAYWRSWERTALVTYKNEEGETDVQFLKGELLDEFIEDYGLKKLRNISIEEAQREGTQEDTIIYGWMPVVHGGIKINMNQAGRTGEESLYIGGGPLDLQLKDNSDVFNTILPVVGFVGKSPVERMMPYIMMHDIALNQVVSLLEKETGMFLIFDFQFLPSEFKESGDVIENLQTLYEAIREVGIVPIDTSKQNLQGTNPMMNTFQTQNLDYTALIQNRMALAEKNKWMALEQFGITPQRAGTTTSGLTAEGIKAGTEASYSQTEDFFSEMDVAQSKATVVHLHVAQTCQREGKDYKNYYLRSNGEKGYLATNDENLPLRMFDVHVINSPKHKRDVMQLKETILATNTLGSDIQALAEMVSSKSIQEIKEVGIQANKRKVEAEEAQRAHEQELKDKDIQAMKEKDDTNREQEMVIKELENSTKVEVALINAQGRMADNDVSDDKAYDRVERNRDIAIKAQNMQLQGSIASSRFELEREKLEESKRSNRVNEEIAMRNVTERGNNRQARLTEKFIK